MENKHRDDGNNSSLLRRVRRCGGYLSKGVQVVHGRQVLRRRMPKEALGDAQGRMQATCRRATRRGAVQGPSTDGGMSHLLPANADKIVILYDASTRDYGVRTDLRLCECKCGVG